jgi:hypothetical protein
MAAINFTLPATLFFNLFNDEPINDDDDVYLINCNMAVGYKIYLHTNTDQLERHKYKMISIRKDDN